MKDKDIKKGLRLSSQCLTLAFLEATYKGLISQHNEAKKKLDDFDKKHKLK